MFAAKDSATLAEEIRNLQQDIEKLRSISPSQNNYGFLLSSPYVGLRATYDDSALLTNLPSIDTDLRLLEQRRDIVRYMSSQNIAIPDRPIVALSGAIEGEASFGRDYTGGGKSYIDLSRAELDLLGQINPWITTAIFICYDDTASSSGAVVTNSKVYLDSAFITLGDLEVSPWYGTIGQLYVPFGQYYNYMVTTPLIKDLARTRERAIELGYRHNGINAAVYGYKGDTYVSDHSNEINDWGVNLSYDFNWKSIDISIGGGYINNIAESEGMMDNGDTTDGHFDGFYSHQQLHHFVPAVDLNGWFQYKDYTLVMEYINVTRDFDRADLSFNGKGASPRALDVEINYGFNFIDKISTIALGYGRTWDALALNLSKHSAFVNFSIALVKFTVESIEFRHDWNYGKNDTASGGGGGDYSPVGARTRNAVTAQVGVYF